MQAASIQRPTSATLIRRSRTLDDSHANYSIVLLLTLIVLVFAFPVLLILETGQPIDPIAALPFVFITGWSGCRLALVTVRAGRALPSLIFYLFCYIWLGLAPLLQLQNGRGPLPYPIGDEDYLRAGVLVVLGLMVFEIAKKASSVAPAHGGRQPAEARLMLFSWVVIAFSIAMVAYVGGPAALWSSRQEFSAGVYGEGTDKAFGAVVSSLLIAPPFVALGALIHRGRGASSRLAYASTVVPLLGLNVLINNPISQGRFWFTTVWASLAILLLLKREIGLSLLPLLFVVGTLVIFPNADIFRYENSTLQNFEFIPPGDQLKNKGDFDSIQQIALGIVYVADQGFALGAQALSTLLFFVPRAIWPTKAIDTGSVLANYVGFGNANLSAPLWIEAYIDGGILMVVAAFVVLGIVHGRLESLRAPSLGTVVFALYQLVLLRGSLLASMATGSVVLATYLVCTVGTRGDTREPELDRRSQAIS
jgi:hypothetical protein